MHAALERLDPAHGARPRSSPWSRSRTARRRPLADLLEPVRHARERARAPQRSRRAALPSQPRPEPRPARSRGCAAPREAHIRRGRTGTAGHRTVARASRHGRASALVGEDPQLGLAVALARRRAGRGGRPRRSAAPRTRARTRRRPRAGSSSTRTRRGAPGRTDPDQRCQRRADVPGHRHGEPGRAPDRARAARPSSSCRSCRSRPRTGSAAAARPARARPITSMPALQRGGDHRRLARARRGS